MEIIIATPFYEVKAYSPYILSLLDSIRALNMVSIKWDYYEHSGDSYVDRAKNTIAHRFMESDATHLFMIDSDLRWDVKGFMRVVMAAKAGADVVGGAFPNKNNWSTFGCALMTDNDGFPVGKEKGNMRLLECAYMPGGFLIYSKKALSMVHDSIKQYTDPGAREKPDTKFYEYFRCEVADNGGRMGEDIYFQNKFRQAGGKIFLEPRITFEHYGVKGWKGCYHEYLLRQKTVLDAQGATIETLKLAEKAKQMD